MTEPKQDWPATWVFLFPRGEEEDALVDALCERHEPEVVRWEGTKAECVAIAQDHWNCQPLGRPS